MSKGNRPYDYLYGLITVHSSFLDNDFVVGGQTDHLKQVQNAQTFTMQPQPVFENMFSNLSHYPAVNLHYLAVKGPQQLSQKMNQYAHLKQYVSDMVLFSSHHNTVTGANRSKYFRRPIIPFVPMVTGNIVYEKKRPIVIQSAKKRAASPLTKTVAVQTIYRESYAQTDPFSPAYVQPELQPGEPVPELLSLSTLTYGHGLPAGLVEIELIERARMKRIWEASLPKGQDANSYEKRLKMMEVMELEEWKEREREIARIQNARLDVLKNLIKKREEEHEQINQDRLEKIWIQKLQERDVLMEQLNKKRAKELKRIEDRRASIGKSKTKRDIIADYANQVTMATKFKPMPYKNLPLRNDLTEIIQVEQVYAPMMDGNVVKQAEDPIWGRKQMPTVDASYEEQLRLLDEKIREKRTELGTASSNKPLRFAQKIEKPGPRPVTPELPLDQDETKAQAAILLQKLIRGRVVQNQIIKGKEKRLPLIEEIRIRFEIYKEQGYSNVFKRSESEAILSAQETADKKMEAQELIQVEYKSADPQARELETVFQAEYTGKMFDYYTKELVRLREERKIAALVFLAERTRRMREAEETGRREEELARRQFEEEAFKQASIIHAETVDTFLQDIILENTQKTAEIKAKQSAMVYAEELNSLLDSLSLEEPNDEKNVADMVYGFLIPNVERTLLQEQVENDQKKYLMAAQKVILETIKKDSANVEEN